MRLQIDPSTEPLFVKTSPEYKYYKEFSSRFGSDYMIAIAMATPDLFADNNLEILRDLTDRITTYPQVERVVSLANAMDIRHRFLGVKVEPALEEFFEKPQSRMKNKKKILTNELFRNNLVSPSGQVANILVYLKPSGEDRESSGTFIKKLKELLASYKQKDLAFYIAGSPVEQYDFIRYIRRDQLIFVPTIVILLVLCTWLIYRNFSCVILAMSIVFMALIWTMGSISLLGQELNLVTSLLAPVVMIISVANSIHIISLFLEIRAHHQSLKEGVLLTMQQLGVPCFLTHFAAILGFLAGAISPVPAIQSFGLFAALGTFYSYVAEMILTPILLPILPYRSHREVKGEHFFNRLIVGFLENIEFHWKWLILAGTIAIMVFSFLGIQKLKVDTSLVKQMKADSPLAISTRFIDENLTGVYSLGFVLERKDGKSVIDYETLRRIDQFKTFLEGQPEIVKVNTVTTLIKKINQARDGLPISYRIPKSEGRLKAYFEAMAESDNADLWKVVTPDFKQVRLEGRMRAVGTSEGALMEERVRRYMDDNLSDMFVYHLTGHVVLLGKIAKDLVKCQMDGFGFAFASILILITLLFRSFKMGLLAAVPNLLPIFAIYGLMGYCEIELSSPTAMISAIVLGMVVDATVHFLYRFKLEFAMRQHYLQSLHHTFRNVGQRLSISTIILCVGFASSAFASFRPTIHFGVLVSVTIFFAYICTLVIVPVFLVMLKPCGKEKLFRRSSQSASIDTPLSPVI